MKKLVLLSAAGLTLTAAAQAQDQRQLDTFASTGEFFDEAQTLERLELVGIFWDERCAAVEYTYNTDGAPNAVFGAPISAAQTVQAVQDGLDRWNANPAAFISMDVTEQRSLGNRPRQGLDFINEVTFITAPDFGALASSPSTSLQADTEFVAGADLNGDGNPDVFDPEVEGRNTCFDADGDGDIEFPAGFYKAGTILDNDVQFSSTVFWELEPSNSTAADIDAVSTHEFGHSHGHNHAILNQISDTDGSGTTMFPFIDTGDAQAEATTRTPHVDDLAISAFIYPEGSASEGIAALQAGDVRFEDAYDIISGEVTNGAGEGVAGAALTAIDENGDRLVSTYSGRTQVVEIPGAGIFLVEALGIPGLSSVISGEYELPVPTGSSYTVAMQALDGDPVAASRVSTNALIGDLLGQLNFPEEFYNRGTESASEARPDRNKSVASDSSGIDLITDEQIVIRNHDGEVNFIGTGAIFGAETITYGESFSSDIVLPALEAGDALVAGRARTGTLDASLPVVFNQATLALGRPDGEGGFTVTRVLKTEEGTFGQESDSAPVFFNGTKGLSQKIKSALRKDPSLHVFFTISTDSAPAGPSGFPARFVAVDTSNAGSSYLSVNGAPLTLRQGSGWIMDLRVAP